MSKIDLDELERIARAADKDSPGVCYSADHVDGYPIHDSAMALFNAMNPATVMSLIRHARDLHKALEMALRETNIHNAEYRYVTSGTTIHAWLSLLAAGAIQYGRAPRTNDERWDIDQPAED